MLSLSASVGVHAQTIMEDSQEEPLAVEEFSSIIADRIKLLPWGSVIRLLSS